MQFFLTYKGPLPSNGSVQAKSGLRCHFHSQLLELWRHPPLDSVGPYVGREEAQIPGTTRSTDYSSIKQVGQQWYAPLVTTALDLLADLEITMLRVQPAGRLICAGDIDNRLKTLLDALAMPGSSQQIHKDERTSTKNTPTYCLLEDDGLIRGLSIRTERLLHYDKPSEVALLIRVELRATRVTLANLVMIG